MTKDKALDLALEALDGLYEPGEMERVNRAIAALKQARSAPVPTNCRHCGGPDNVLCGGQCKQALAAPTVQEPVAYRQTGWAAHRDQYAVPVLFNPYTGDPRDVRDVQSDPQGILIVPPGKVEMLAAKPTVKESLQVATPPAQRTWVGLTDDDIIAAYETSGHKQAIRPQDVFAVAALARAIEAKLKEKNNG